MRIQCNVCEAAEANVLCCADEAALCLACDQQVHAANKLASKHQRVRLTNSSSKMPKCDICQEVVGYFFCLEDRALLCRECDVAIHTANDFVSGHQRFLLTGVRVGTEPIETGPSSNLQPARCLSNVSVSRSSSVSVGASQSPSPLQRTKPSSSEVGRVKPLYSGGAASTTLPCSQIDELLGCTEFGGNYPCMDRSMPSKVGGVKLVQIDFSAPSDEADMDDCFCKVPEVSWSVPEMPSPDQYGPFWAKNAGIASVPDVPFLSAGTHHLQPNNDRRQFYF